MRIISTLLIALALSSSAQAGMSFEEFFKSAKAEIGQKIDYAKQHVTGTYDENMSEDPEHAVVDTAQDVVVDSGKAIWNLGKEAVDAGKTLYKKHIEKE